MAALPNILRAATGSLRAALLATAAAGLAGQDQRAKCEWDAPSGFDVQVDAAGFTDPVAIAVVPKPGAGADDPRYFVAERGGRVKVVTNDRRVLVFAELPCGAGHPERRTELQDLVLAPEHGCLFVSLRTSGTDGPLASDLVRIELQPGSLSSTPCHWQSLRGSFDQDPAFAHRAIGPIAVLGSALFVGFENPGDPRESRDLDAAGGKILRMDLAGRPLADNPFFTADGAETVRDYVWALGLRCPVSLVVAEDTLFASDRGLEFIRVLQVRRGSDHNFDGTRWSLGIRPDAVFGASFSTARLAFVPSRRSEAPDGGGTLLLALAGADQITEVGITRVAHTVVSLAVQPGGHELTGKPSPFLSCVGHAFDSPRDVGLGQDAVFVVTGASGAEDGAVLRVAYGHDACFRAAAPESPSALIASRGCYVCHESGTGDVPGARSLESHVLAARLMKRLHSETYLAALDAVDLLREPPFEIYGFARKDVRQAVGMARVRTWLRHKLVEPRFDEPGAVMPCHGLTNEQAAGVVEELLHDLPDTADLGLLDRVRLVVADLVPHPRQRHLLFCLLIGFLVGCGVTIGLLLVRRRLRADRRPV